MEKVDGPAEGKRSEAESASEGDAAVHARERTADASAPIQPRRVLREALGSADAAQPALHQLPAPAAAPLTYSGDWRDGHCAAVLWAQR